VGTIYLVQEAFALCDPEVVSALQVPVERIRQLFGGHLVDTSIHVIDGEPPGTAMTGWYEKAFSCLQWAEIWSSLGAWVTSTQADLGPVAAHNLEMVRRLSRSSLNETMGRRERYCRGAAAFLRPCDLLCIPTVPAPPPRKGTVGRRDQDETDYYPRALALTSLSGVARLPQVSLPLARCNGGPVGLSLLAGFGQDAFLLGVVRRIAEGGLP
jgi:amidase